MPAYRAPTETTFLNGHQETEPFPDAGLFHFRGERLAADLREHHVFVFAVVVAECAFQLATVLRYVEHDSEISIESY